VRLPVYQPTDTSESAILNWLSQINDCSNVSVRGFLPSATYVIRNAIELQILDCGNPNRTVEIYGTGRNSSIIDIQSSKDCGDGMGFVVYGPNVTIHDLALRGRQTADGSGRCGEGIKFVDSTAAFGTVYNTKVSSFGNGAIDVYNAPGAYIHDNFIDCNGSDATGASSGPNSMGVWVRWIQRPPPPGVNNATVNSNAIFGCASEAIALAGVIHVSVYYNTIRCDVGGGVGTPACWIGITLFSDASSNSELSIFGTHLDNCDARPVSSNAIGYNTIYGSNRLNVGIASEGTGSGGSGHDNLIEHNTISHARQHGIQTASTDCPFGTPSSAFSGYTIASNDVSNSLDTQIWVGGSYTRVTNNRVRNAPGSNGIYFVSTAVGITNTGNVSY